MRRKRIDDKGVAGFFEDLPSFMIIMIALAVFISSIFYSSITYIRTWEENEKFESCQEVLENLENYDKLLIRGSYTAQPIAGYYSFEKLKAMNTTVLKTDIRSDYDYNVTIVDLRNSSLTWNFGDEQPTGKIEKVSLYTTIVIKIEENEVHLARLKVTIW